MLAYKYYIILSENENNIPNPLFWLAHSLISWSIFVNDFVVWMAAEVLFSISMDFVCFVLVQIVSLLPIQLHALLSAYLNMSIQLVVDPLNHQISKKNKKKN